MIAFSKDYRPVLEVSPFFTIKDLESDLVKYLMNFGEEFEISHLGSYSKFQEKHLILLIVLFPADFL